MTVRGMRGAAAGWLGSLDDAQREKATHPFDDEAERRTWYYWPAPRKGLALAEMDASQRKLAQALLAEGLSLPAYAKACQIIALESVLDELEGGQGSQRGLPRDPSLYFVTVFGEPDDDEWGWRFEGHHLSVHHTVVGDEVRTVPLFLGANPAVVRHGRSVVSRPLGEEEDAAKLLLSSLDDSQRRLAVVSDDAPDDILTSNLPEIGDQPVDGLSGEQMGREQRELLDALVSVYIDRVPEARREPVDLNALAFSWAGSTEPGGRHYYRVVGPTLVIEYDNTQNDANHVHAVWRDTAGDFGADLLRAHLAQDHRPVDTPHGAADTEAT